MQTDSDGFITAAERGGVCVYLTRRWRRERKTDAEYGKDQLAEIEMKQGGEEKSDVYVFFCVFKKMNTLHKSHFAVNTTERS